MIYVEVLITRADLNTDPKVREPTRLSENGSESSLATSPVISRGLRRVDHMVAYLIQ